MPASLTGVRWLRSSDEVARTAAHCFDGELDGSPGRHDDYGQRSIERLNAVEQLQAFLTGGGIARVIEVHEE